MKPTQSIVIISLCAGMALSAFANTTTTANNACQKIRQQCTSNNLSTATCERRVEHCHHQMAKRHENQVKHYQQNNQPSTQQANQPSTQQAGQQVNTPGTQQQN